MQFDAYLPNVEPMKAIQIFLYNPSFSPKAGFIVSIHLLYFFYCAEVNFFRFSISRYLFCAGLFLSLTFSSIAAGFEIIDRSQAVQDLHRLIQMLLQAL